MDLVETLRSKIAALDDGDHISGLRATLGHIEVAFRHLARGQSDGDEAAFTDAIYRTNQAFEGGIKEAYRVLTGNDPQKKTPHFIENYLEENGIFRGRVLNQFRNYRTEWRNPSTHDYQLYFDESEAFLAIVSVSAFACLLSDQIVSKIAFDASKDATEAQFQALPKAAEKYSLYSRASSIVQDFASTYNGMAMTGRTTEAILLGSLHGAFASIMPDVEVVLEPQLSSESHYHADMILKKGDESLIIELKRFRENQGLVAAREQVEKYLEVSGIDLGLLVFMPDSPEEIEILEYELSHVSRRIGILLPKRAIKR